MISSTFSHTIVPLNHFSESISRLTVSSKFMFGFCFSIFGLARGRGRGFGSGGV